VYGGAVHNPINALAAMIADLHDDDHRVTVEGFYDDVRDLTEAERASYRALPFDEAAWKDEAGVAATRTEAGYGILEGTSGRPTLDCNGIWGGYTGQGAKTVLPSKASAKISCRLVADQQPGDITDKLRRHFEAHVPETMALTFTDLHGGHGVIVDTEAPAMQAASVAMEAVFGQKPFFTREGGSIPIVADFKRILGLDTVLMGFGLDSDSIHSPNERFGLDRFHQGIEASVRFMDAFARQAA
ncbi:MAG: M20/M25/M40 family metallo-hydrolase, partial [Bacteroidota bacterium]